MHLRFTLKAVQSVQSFSPDMSDEVVLLGELLGIPIAIPAPDDEILRKLDNLLSSQTTHHVEVPRQDAGYTSDPSYLVGEVGDD